MQESAKNLLFIVPTFYCLQRSEVYNLLGKLDGDQLRNEEMVYVAPPRMLENTLDNWK